MDGNNLAAKRCNHNCSSPLVVPGSVSTPIVRTSEPQISILYGVSTIKMTTPFIFHTFVKTFLRQTIMCDYFL